MKDKQDKLISLKPDTLKRLTKLAERNGRKTKNYIEWVLEDHVKTEK